MAMAGGGLAESGGAGTRWRAASSGGGPKRMAFRAPFAQGPRLAGAAARSLTYASPLQSPESRDEPRRTRPLPTARRQPAPRLRLVLLDEHRRHARRPSSARS